MASITKATLLADNHALRNELNTLRSNYEQLKAELLNVTEVASAINVVNDARRPAPVGFFEAKAAAKMSAALAAASGTTNTSPVRVNPKPAYVSNYVAPAWQAERVAAMAAARELAMSSNTSVRA